MKPLRRLASWMLRTPLNPGAGDPAPLDLAGDDRAVLCLHGLTGTPFEVAPLARAFAARGMTVMAPMLAGHGADADTLAATTWSDWLQTARDGLARLRGQTGRRIAIAGFSTGALLALHLAASDREAVGALVLMSPPLRLRRHQELGIRTLASLPPVLRRGFLHHIPKRGGSDVADPEVRKQVPSLPVMPVQALDQMLQLAETVRPRLSQISAPALIVHGQHDRTVPMEDALELAGSLGSETIERLWLPRSGHLVAVDLDKQTLCDRAVRFVSQHLA